MIIREIFCRMKSTSKTHQESKKKQRKEKGNISLFFFKFLRFQRFSPYAGKYGPEKLRIWTLFRQCIFRHVELNCRKKTQAMLQLCCIFMLVLSLENYENRNFQPQVLARPCVLQHVLLWSIGLHVLQGFSIFVFLEKVQPHVLSFSLPLFTFFFQIKAI